MALTELPSVAKSKGRPRRSERDDVTVKVDRTLVGRLKTIAVYRGVPLAELISEALRTPTAKMWNEMVRDSGKEAE